MRRNKIVGTGFGRLVFDLPHGKVIKLATSEYGRRSNRREVNIFRSSPARIRKYLGRIESYAEEYGWIVMKKYPRRFPPSRKYRRRLARLRRLFGRHGFAPYEVVAAKTGKPNYQNLRTNRGGRIVVIDYGNFQRRMSPIKCRKEPPAPRLVGLEVPLFFIF